MLSHASPPLNLQLHEMFSFQFSGADVRSGPPAPFQRPMYSFSACSASLLELSSSPAVAAGANRTNASRPRIANRFIRDPRGECSLWGVGRIVLVASSVTATLADRSCRRRSQLPIAFHLAETPGLLRACRFPIHARVFRFWSARA